MKEMIEIIARALEDQPDAASVTEINRSHASIIELSIAKEDIGKQERTADTLRTLFNAVSSKAKTRSRLEIIDYPENWHRREVAAMIVVRITMHVLPEKQKELVQTILSMVGSMEKAAGCMNYALFCNLEDSNLLNIIEEWQTRKDLDNHLKSDIFGVLLGTKSLLAEPHGIHIYTIQQSEGMEAVHAARGK